MHFWSLKDTVKKQFPLFSVIFFVFLSSLTFALNHVLTAYLSNQHATYTDIISIMYPIKFILWIPSLSFAVLLGQFILNIRASMIFHGNYQFIEKNQLYSNRGRAIAQGKVLIDGIAFVLIKIEKCVSRIYAKIYAWGLSKGISVPRICGVLSFIFALNMINQLLGISDMLFADSFNETLESIAGSIVLNMLIPIDIPMIISAIPTFFFIGKADYLKGRNDIETGEWAKWIAIGCLILAHLNFANPIIKAIQMMLSAIIASIRGF